jgi:lipid II:glycine glycyltransferase (peptidoglycan interpeptide bridge formation enzyme)
MAQLLDRKAWDEFLSQRESVHLLQTGAWGALKSEFGWQAIRIVNHASGAQILFRSLPFGRTIAYIPKGPLGPDWQALLPEIDRLCRDQRAIALKIEPDGWQDRGTDERTGPPPGFRMSPRPIQPVRTFVLDLTPEESVLLSNMKQKTRYNIRLARRKGVVVRLSQDLETFNDLIQITGERDAFGVHAPAYYRRAYDLFNPHGMCDLLVAEYDHQPLAALMLFTMHGRAWYLYGASSNQHRNFMPTYLLQWEAIRRARNLGCLQYDLYGVPDYSLETLEAEFAGRSDGLWGVYRFKRGFGGSLLRAAGPWDRVYSPALYGLMNWWTARSASV